MLNRRRAVLFAVAAAAGFPLAAQAAPTPATLFAPYVDMSSWPTPNLTTLYNDSGTNHYTLAFITATGPNDTPANAPAWGGYPTYAPGSGQLDAGINSGIAALRSHAGDVGISFGGQSGTDLADTTTSLSTLQSDYQTVLNTYNVHRVDFDIEGTDPANHAAVDLRFAAIANIQQAAPAGAQLAVSLTLPVEPTGLDSNALYAVQSAISHGVTLSTVNVMAMQFGDYNAPNGTTQMGDYVVQSAQSTFSQLKTLYNGAKTDAQIYAMLGITPMIGQNSPDEIFTASDANKVGMWAAEHRVGFLSFWLATRDHTGSGSYVSETDSGIAQSDYQFARIFQAWANAIPGDANLDGKVDFDDFLILSQNFGQAGNWNAANFDGAATVDFNDFLILSQNFGQSVSGSSVDVTPEESAEMNAFLTGQQVPEPASLPILAMAIIALTTVRRGSRASVRKRARGV